MGTYSFLDVNCTIVGPGGSFSLGAGAGVAEEGITTAMNGEKNTMTIGADGTPMNSLHGDKSGKLTVRLLKTSSTNALLSTLYALQTSSSALHGQNVIVVSNPVTGDVITCQSVAFAKLPDNVNAKAAGMMAWEFHAGIIDEILGTGSPSAI